MDEPLVDTGGDLELDGTNFPLMFVSFVATCLALLLALSPMREINQVKKNEQVGPLQFPPFVGLFLNSFMATFYGWLVGNQTILYCNVVNLVLSIYYIQVYYQYSKEKQQLHLWILGTGVLLMVVVYHVLYRVDPEDAPTNLGVISNISTIFMFAAPLGALREVFKQKNAVSIMLPLAWAGFACSLAWLIFGAMLNDIFVMFPNIIGMILSAIQIGLVFLFGQRPLVQEKNLSELSV